MSSDTFFNQTTTGVWDGLRSDEMSSDTFFNQTTTLKGLNEYTL